MHIRDPCLLGLCNFIFISKILLSSRGKSRAKKGNWIRCCKILQKLEEDVFFKKKKSSLVLLFSTSVYRKLLPQFRHIFGEKNPVCMPPRIFKYFPS